MKKQKKNNNKGFSLVELIVVVLIMAIIAVALAPQVMKWVDNSKLATDVQTYDSLVANCQLALTNQAAYNEVKTNSDKKITIKIKSDGTTIEAESGGTCTAFEAAMDELDSSWKELKLKSSANNPSLDIEITKTGVEKKSIPATSDDFE